MDRNLTAAVMDLGLSTISLPCTPVKKPSPSPSTSIMGATRSLISPRPSHTAFENVTPSVAEAAVTSCNIFCTDNSCPLTSPIASTSFSIPPSQIRPLPKMTGVRQKTNKARVSTTILTSTPYKSFLEEEMNKKNEKICKKNKRNDNKKTTKLNSKITNTKVSLKGKGKENVTKNIKGPKPKKRRCEINESSSEDEDDAECLFCNELFRSNNNRGEGWIQCCVCLRWGHDACAGVDPDDADEFTCDFCADNPFARARKQLKL